MVQISLSMGNKCPLSKLNKWLVFFSSEMKIAVKLMQWIIFEWSNSWMELRITNAFHIGNYKKTTACISKRIQFPSSFFQEKKRMFLYIWNAQCYRLGRKKHILFERENQKNMFNSKKNDQQHKTYVYFILIVKCSGQAIFQLVFLIWLFRASVPFSMHLCMIFGSYFRNVTDASMHHLLSFWFGNWDKYHRL